MKKTTKNVSARIQFTADKMLQKMKKCLEKKDPNVFKVFPAIEMETGIMVATTGHVLAAHKLKDYHFDPSDGAVLGDMMMLPKEVLQMKGRVEVTVAIDGYETVTTATDEKGETAELRQTSRYPRWRSVIPQTTGWPIDVDWKAWDAALKEIVAKQDSSIYPVRLYGEQGSKTLAFCWENYDMDERGQKDVGVGEMPYKMWVSLNGKYLRDLLAMQPTEMRFVDSSRAVLFVGEDTLLLIMPLLDADVTTCTVDKRYYSTFDLEKWVGADLGTVVVDNRADVKPETKAEPTLAERLRAALLKQFRQAA